MAPFWSGDRWLRLNVSLQVHPKCPKRHSITKRALAKNLTKNASYLCLYCSRRSKFSGRGNPNSKYQLREDFLDEIDTEEKAYILGLFASDGTLPKGALSIDLHRRDEQILFEVRAILYEGSHVPKIKPKKETLMSLTISNRAMAETVRSHLKCGTKKADNIKFPELSPYLRPAFVRGVFDGDGHVKKKRMECGITTSSLTFRESLLLVSQEWEIPGRFEVNDKICWSGLNALDFLGKIYDKSNIHLNRKRDLYLSWCHWRPGHGGRPALRQGAKFTRCRSAAVYPSKTRVSDSGHDLTLVEKIKQIGLLSFYGTGLKVQPPDGFYFDMIARSSLQKRGYMLANAVGIIDRAYRGEIIAGLFKFDPDAPDLELPARVLQLVPRPIEHFSLVEVEDLDQTSRGTGGFGSTGR